MEIDFSKGNGLVPAIVQDADSRQVLMLGYMNQEAVDQSLSTQKVTFFSRSKNRIWVKGETSGNFLMLESIQPDCDRDALLVLARPTGPVCHTGSENCFQTAPGAGFLGKLTQTIGARKGQDPETSYTALLFEKGIKKIAQKVGEEAVEVVLEAQTGTEEDFLNESADLLYHYMVLLAARGHSLSDVEAVLFARNHKN